MQTAEFLTPDELEEVTGYKHIAKQREWLDMNNWPYVVNAHKKPIVSRVLVRTKLAGIDTFQEQSPQQQKSEVWTPDFSALG